MFSSATQPPLCRGPPPRHNFVVSAITFEGFKLRSLDTCITRTSSIIDIAVPSKMADGSHFVKNFKKIKVVYRSEMDRNEIESDFRTKNILKTNFVFI